MFGIDQRWNKGILSIVLMVNLLSVQYVLAGESAYLCDVGLQAGVGYYIGDGTQHSFNHVREAYGVQLRYKFDQRWALQMKGQGQRIAYTKPNVSERFHNQLFNFDVVGEFNFFRFDKLQYDERVKQITPYIFLGMGVSFYDGVKGIGPSAQINKFRAAAYVPFGIGLKCKVTEHFGIHIAWQQNLYFADNLENVVTYNNPNELNGSNILWNDFTSSLTIGIVFEFGKTGNICRTCE